MILALGGNLDGAAGAPHAALNAALERLSACGVAVVKRSRWWRSAAWPDPRDPPFLNAVALVATGLAPAPLLTVLHAVETEFGRVRERTHAPRTVDLDLIAHGRLVIQTPGLALPHPRAADRGFVMGPLAEIAPDWRHPVLGRTARALYAEAAVGRDARPL